MRKLVLPLVLAGWSGPVLAQEYPFEGTWDCGVAIFSFSAQIYNNGSENMVIADIAADGSSYFLTFEDDYQLALSVNPDGTLSWFSPASGDSFTCTPVK